MSLRASSILPAVAFIGGLGLTAWIRQADVHREPEVSGVPVVGEPMPREEAALFGWLMQHAEAPTPDLNRLIASQPGVAVWVSLALPAEQRSPELTMALAPAVYDLRDLEVFAEQVGVHVEQARMLLRPSALSILLARCPDLPPELQPLCSPEVLIATERKVDALVAAQLGTTDERLHLLAIEQAIGLGERGAMLAARVLAGEVPSSSPGQQRASAVLVRSWTLPEDVAVAELVGYLDPDDPAALVAALELGRLGAAEAAEPLAVLAEALSGTSEGVVVRYAHALVTGEVHTTFAEELQPPGL